ncbi:MAG: pyridoxamine kinase [Clostridia bacterium]
MQALPRVAAIADLSGFGKCALTVALPILSAAGVEVCALPTAVLSSHTGDLQGYTYRDLTEDMPAIAAHWASLGLTFDAIYTGFLGSGAQLAIVLDFLRRFRRAGTLVLVDPVMGDHGKVYQTYTPEMVAGMGALCAQADLITPNLTEASLLLGIPYRESIHDAADIRALCTALHALGPTQVVVTGISISPNEIGAAAYDARTDTVSVYGMPHISGIWYGTGDIFGSVLLGALLAQKSLADASRMAVHFTYDCIARTHTRGTDPRFGVDFEHGLPELIQMLQLPTSMHEIC